MQQESKSVQENPTPIKTETKETKETQETQEAKEKTIFQKLGGSEGMLQIAEKFYKKISEDEDLKEKYFKGANTRVIIESQMKFLGTLLGDEEEWKGLALHDIHVDVFVEKEDFIK